MKLIYIFFFISIFAFSCKNPSRNHANAVNYLHEGNLEKAKAEIDKAIKLEPDSINHYLVRILIYSKTGQYKEEILDLNEILNLKNANIRDSVFAYRERAAAEIQLGLFEEALSDINYFIENRDTIGVLAEAYLNKATILYKLNDFDNAAKFYNLTLKENNDASKSLTTQVLVGQANLCASPKEAMKLLNKAIKIDSTQSLVYGARMALYMESQNTSKAYEDGKKALILNPTDAIINFNMGQLFTHYLINNDSAIIYFKKAIDLAPQSPNNSVAYMNIAVIYQTAGNTDEALSYFQKAEEINPNNDVTLYNYALLLSDLNRNNDALKKINNAIAINHNDPSYYNLKGTLLLSNFSFDEAEQEFFKAVKLNSKNGEVLYNLGYLYGEKNNHEQSINYYTKAVQVNFDLEATLVNRALQYIKLNKVQSACADLHWAYNLGRSDIKPLMNQYCN